MLAAPCLLLRQGLLETVHVRLNACHMSVFTTSMSDNRYVRARYAWQAHAAPPQDERAAAEDAAHAAAREARRRATRAAFEAQQAEVQPSRHH